MSVVYFTFSPTKSCYVDKRVHAMSNLDQIKAKFLNTLHRFQR